MSFHGFDNAWLRSYQAKQAGAIAFPDSFGFTLGHPVKLLNELLRMHWSRRSEYASALSAEIAAKTQHLPVGAKPLERARVTVTRYSLLEPDFENLVGSVKAPVDCLLVRSDRHPRGLGFLVDDSPKHIVLIVRAQVVAKRSEQRTTVLIERLPTERTT